MFWLHELIVFLRVKPRAERARLRRTSQNTVFPGFIFSLSCRTLHFHGYFGRGVRLICCLRVKNRWFRVVKIQDPSKPSGTQLGDMKTLQKMWFRQHGASETVWFCGHIVFHVSKTHVFTFNLARSCLCGGQACGRGGQPHTQNERKNIGFWNLSS